MMRLSEPKIRALRALGIVNAKRRQKRTGVAGRTIDSPVNFTPVADAQDKDERHPVVDMGDQSIIADPIFPEIAEFRAFECFANASRVVRRCNSLVQKPQDALGDGAIEAAQVLMRQCR